MNNLKICGILILLLILFGCSKSNFNCVTQEQMILINENIIQIGKGQETLNDNLKIIVDNQNLQRENLKIMQDNIIKNVKNK